MASEHYGNLLEGNSHRFRLCPERKRKKLLFSPPRFGSGESNETGCPLALENSTEGRILLILSALLCLIMRGCPNCFGGMNAAAAAAGVVRVAEVVGFAQSRRSKFIDCRQNFGATFSRSGGGAKQREFFPLHSCYDNCSALLSLFEDFCGGTVLSV